MAPKGRIRLSINILITFVTDRFAINYLAFPELFSRFDRHRTGKAGTRQISHFSFSVTKLVQNNRLTVIR
jgi:hypothetical protein